MISKKKGGQLTGAIKGKSLGLKLLLVCALVLLMSIPALFISMISYERAGRARDVTQEISQRYGGAQTMLGPVLTVPYGIKDGGGTVRSYSEYIFFAEEGSANIAEFETKIRSLSLFEVPTYQANVDFKAVFNLPDKKELAGDRYEFYWDQAKISIGLSDVRALRDDVRLNVTGAGARKFGPASEQTLVSVMPKQVNDAGYRAKGEQIQYKPYYDHVNLQFMDVGVGDLIVSGKRLVVTARLPISGSQKVSIAPFAQTTKASINSDWPHPGFVGAYPPITRELGETGFRAEWSVPYLARGMAAHGGVGSLVPEQLLNKTMSVKFVSPASPYQSVNRALKYAVLFIGIVFLSYFLFETLVGIRVHAAQYVLVGLAQCVFYLLLLAFSEHFGFALAFGVAACATVAATTLYASVVFGRGYRLKAFGVFASTYGLLYVLMRMQDFALMVGALTCFLAIAGTMYLTRGVNWYGVKDDVNRNLDISK